MNTEISAVLWDFGGVILSSPFEAFNNYESVAGLPKDLIRTINASNADTNAWAQLERAEVNHRQFCALFEAEALQLGHVVDADKIMHMLHGTIRPEMVEALDRVKAAGYAIALLTNNFVSMATAIDPERDVAIRAILTRFDAVVESSVVGVRKPDPAFYAKACAMLGVLPTACVFLDDLGVNLKPAAAMGIRTIKVLNADQALTDLETILGIPLR